MPFYEYECSACKHHTEVLQKVSAAPLRKCPSCGRQALKRLISAPVFRLKGGGWYETDFKSDKEQKRNIAGREEGEAKAEESKKEGSEAKPAAAAESKTEASSTAKESAPAKTAAKPKAKPVKAKAAAGKASKRR